MQPRELLRYDRSAVATPGRPAAVVGLGVGIQEHVETVLMEENPVGRIIGDSEWHQDIQESAGDQDPPAFRYHEEKNKVVSPGIPARFRAGASGSSRGGAQAALNFINFKLFQINSYRFRG